MLCHFTSKMLALAWGIKQQLLQHIKKIVSLLSEFFNNAARVAFVSVTNMKECKIESETVL